MLSLLMLSTTASIITCTADPGRTGYGMAWDGGRQRVVVFGGSSTGGTLTNDLLAWDGSSWSCVATGGPAARADAMLAWDVARKVLVLYGGRVGRSELRDTWEFSGSGWTLRNEQGPTPEPHGVMAYDASAGGILLWSGLGDDGPARATWKWDGAAWTRMATGPDQQFPNAMIGTGSPRLMTARLAAGDVFRAAIHRWTGDGWSEVTVSGDTPEFSPQAPATEMPDGAVLYAGFESNQRVTTWSLHGSIWSRVTGDSPPRRKGAHLQYDPVRKVAVLHAGDDGSRVLSDTWEWDGRAWRRIP